MIASSRAVPGKLEILFAVQDTGIGIVPDRLHRLFQSFSQVDASTTRKYGGTGLGLVICRRLTELLGGSIRLESAPAVGTRVEFTIVVATTASDCPESIEPPDVAPTTSVCDSSRRADAPSLGGRHPLSILLAEDNPINQKVAAAMLARLGYSADAVSNGVEAVAAAQCVSYDLILMDLQMPELDGLAAMRQIRERLAGKSCPAIVALSANAFAEDRARCLAAGMDGYLSKPLGADELEATLIRVSSIRHGHLTESMV